MMTTSNDLTKSTLRPCRIGVSSSLRGLGVAAAPLLSQVAFGAPAAGSDEADGKTPLSVRAWDAASATSPVEVMEIQRRAARNIRADIELIRPDQISQAFERVVNKDIRYRFVIDMKSARA